MVATSASDAHRTRAAGRTPRASLMEPSPLRRRRRSQIFASVDRCQPIQISGRRRARDLTVAPLPRRRAYPITRSSDAGRAVTASRGSLIALRGGSTQSLSGERTRLSGSRPSFTPSLAYGPPTRVRYSAASNRASRTAISRPGQTRRPWLSTSRPSPRASPCKRRAARHASNCSTSQP